ncbi:MAG: glycosyl hydrolase [Gemmatimonadaceae bacterium]|nr:glycosyl hydrolase [Gemmatimonadaceae bacterium]
METVNVSRTRLRFASFIVSAVPFVAVLAQGTAKPAARPPVPRAVASAVAPLSAPFDSSAFGSIRWREIGPFRGGRTSAVAGSVARPREYWMGSEGGGVLKSMDGGLSWLPMTDSYFGGTIGAIAVAPSNPDIVYVGGGEFPIRGNVSHGDGVWKTADGGKTWTNIGLNDTRQIAKVRVHPTNPDLVYVAAQGHVWGPNAERGIFRSKDGGKNWQKVLFRDDSTGAADLAMDPSNPNVLYAGFWQAHRKPWMLVSGGKGSGMFKSVDGGDTWSELTRRPGLPAGLWGNIGISVSGANPRRVYAIIEADEGGVFRSEDAGATWARVNDERKLRQRAWYYTKIYADPKNADVVYASNVNFQVSRDGGKTWTNVNAPHGDSHDAWIAPDNSDRLIEGNDGGATASIDGGKTWTAQDFATAQFYHVSTTNHFPYKICGAQQDNSTLCGPSRAAGGITTDMWMEAGGGESGFVMALPTNPDIVFAGSYGGLLTRKDMRTGLTRDVNPWPLNPMGHSAIDAKYRMQWTFPIVVSPHDPKTIYVGSSVVFRTTDQGDSYTTISPDLTRNDPRTLGPSGGSITLDQTSVEYYGTVFALAESPVTPGVLWAGTDDGLVQLSRDAGKTWTNVTPPLLKEREWARISIIEASRFNAGTAYVAANRFQMDDQQPYLFKTADFGKTWTRIDGSGTPSGLPASEFTRVIREDDVRRGLLFAGTERGVYVSLDDGGSWTSLRRNLPIVPVHDLAIKEGDLIAATHGRSFYVLDDLSALRQLSANVLASNAHLFTPRTTYRINWGGGFGGGGGSDSPVGANPPAGAIVNYWLKQAPRKVTIEFRDSTGRTVRTFSSDTASAGPAAAPRGRRGVASDANPTNRAGMNTFSWNLREADATQFEGMIFWAGSTTGPLILPGTYTVRLMVDGATAQESKFAVKKDPRSDATPADLVAQYKLAMQIRDRTTDANDAVRTVRYVRDQTVKRSKEVGADSARYAALIKSLDTRISEIEAKIYQVKNRSGQDPLNYPIRVNNQIAALAGVVGSADARPTKQSVQVFDILTKELEVYLVDLRAAWKDLLPPIDEILKKHGLPAIEVKPGDVTTPKTSA